MPRPVNKKQLTQSADKNYGKLMEIIDSLSKKEQEGSFGFSDRDKNIRDVIAPLCEWHLMMQRWY